MSTSRNAGKKPAGWYDYAGAQGRGRRYWDGRRWTDQFEFAAGGGSSAAIAPPMAVVRPAPGVTVQQTVVNVGNQKSVVGAVLLALFFGPLGMLYATVPGGLIMFVINVLIAIPTLGLGLLVTVPIGAIWAGAAASAHNRSLATATTQVVHGPATALQPAGWHPDPQGSGRSRYWDGARWTDHFQGSLPAAPVPVPQAPVPELARRSVETADVQLKPKVNAYCESCGASLNARSAFCPDCGAKQAL